MNDLEAYCHRCKGPNVVWAAASPLWNEVMRGGDINGDWEFDEIICPTCFCVLAKERGVADFFRLFSPEPIVRLKEVTPSGRTWNKDTFLWDEPTQPREPDLQSEPGNEQPCSHF